MIGTIATAKKIKREKAFPGRFDWQCSECNRWNRYFEQTCPSCETEDKVTGYEISLTTQNSK